MLYGAKPPEKDGWINMVCPWIMLDGHPEIAHEIETGDVTTIS
jgi:hypothetical protein